MSWTLNISNNELYYYNISVSGKNSISLTFSLCLVYSEECLKRKKLRYKRKINCNLKFILNYFKESMYINFACLSVCLNRSGPNLCGTSRDPTEVFMDDRIFKNLPLTKYDF